MHRDDLNALTRIERVATPAPWFLRALNHDACMSGIGIATTPDPLAGDALVGDWPDAGLVVACLLQSPPDIILDDGLHHQNAALIGDDRASTRPRLNSTRSDRFVIASVRDAMTMLWFDQVTA